MKKKALIVIICPNPSYAYEEGKGGLGHSKRVQTDPDGILNPKENELWEAELIDGTYKLW